MATNPLGAGLIKEWLSGPPRRSQVELARLVGVTQQAVSRWANGEDVPTDINTLLRIEEATDGHVTVESFLDEESVRAFSAVLKRRRHVRRRTPTDKEAA